MTRPRRAPRPAGLAALLVALLSAPGLSAQEPDGDWDDPRTIRVVREAIERRASDSARRALRNFRAEVEGHVYYVGSLEGGGAVGDDRIVRADQVALRVLWQAPDRARQTLIGRRSEKRLPTSIRYHLDHLTLVLNDFDDRIRLGEGTEVRDVLHPAAPGALDHYRYRLVDSLGMTVADHRTTVYRIEVRPEDRGTPGVVGLMDVDPDAGAVVRLRVTFTPASYRDPDLERIELDLRSALWHGRWWLPVEQRQTVARRLRWLHVPLAGVIRTRLRVTDLEVNVDDVPRLAAGHRIVSRPEGELEAYEGWSGGLYESSLVAGSEPVDPESLRKRAAGALFEGLEARPAVSPSLPALSSLFRARRGEGVRLGAAGRSALPGDGTLSLHLGHPFGAGGVSWRARGSIPAGSVSLSAEAYGDQLADAGSWTASSGVVATLGWLIRGEDFRDPYLRDGVTLGAELPAAGGSLALEAALERHRAARRVADPPGDDPVRPLRPADRGDLLALVAGWRRPIGTALDGRWRLELETEAAPVAPAGSGYTALRARLSGRSLPSEGPWSWSAEVRGGLLGGSPPGQRLLTLGGRGTVPGWRFRRWGGDRAAWVRLEAARELVGPWLGLRAIAAAGWAELSGPGVPAARTFGGPYGGRLEGTSGVEPSAGLGIGLLDGALRIDAVRGLDGGRWEWIVSADPRFWEIL